MTLFLAGNLHQGHCLFSVDSRGKQCALVTLSELLTARSIPLVQWSSRTVDNILVQGDKMYTNSMADRLINLDPLDEFPCVVSVENLPKVVSTLFFANMFSYELYQSVNDTSNSNLIIGNEVPVVVEKKQ